MAVRLEFADRRVDAERSAGAGYAFGIGRGLVGIGWPVEPVGKAGRVEQVARVVHIAQVGLDGEAEQVVRVGCSYLVLIAIKP